MQEAGYSDEHDACAILTTYCFKKLAILSLREVVVLFVVGDDPFSILKRYIIILKIKKAKVPKFVEGSVGYLYYYNNSKNTGSIVWVIPKSYLVSQYRQYAVR